MESSRREVHPTINFSNVAEIDCKNNGHNCKVERSTNRKSRRKKLSLVSCRNVKVNVSWPSQNVTFRTNDKCSQHSFSEPNVLHRQFESSLRFHGKPGHNTEPGKKAELINYRFINRTCDSKSRFFDNCQTESILNTQEDGGGDIHKTTMIAKPVEHHGKLRAWKLSTDVFQSKHNCYDLMKNVHNMLFLGSCHIALFQNTVYKRLLYLLKTESRVIVELNSLIFARSAIDVYPLSSRASPQCSRMRSNFTKCANTKKHIDQHCSALNTKKKRQRLFRKHNCLTNDIGFLPAVRQYCMYINVKSATFHNAIDNESDLLQSTCVANNDFVDNDFDTRLSPLLKPFRSCTTEISLREELIQAGEDLELMVLFEQDDYLNRYHSLELLELEPETMKHCVANDICKLQHKHDNEGTMMLKLADYISLPSQHRHQTNLHVAQVHLHPHNSKFHDHFDCGEDTYITEKQLNGSSLYSFKENFHSIADGGAFIGNNKCLNHNNATAFFCYDMLSPKFSSVLSNKALILKNVNWMKPSRNFDQVDKYSDMIPFCCSKTATTAENTSTSESDEFMKSAQRAPTVSSYGRYYKAIKHGIQLMRGVVFGQHMCMNTLGSERSKDIPLNNVHNILYNISGNPCVAKLNKTGIKKKTLNSLEVAYDLTANDFKKNENETPCAEPCIEAPCAIIEAADDNYRNNCNSVEIHNCYLTTLKHGPWGLPINKHISRQGNWFMSENIPSDPRTIAKNINANAHTSSRKDTSLGKRNVGGIYFVDNDDNDYPVCKHGCKGKKSGDSGRSCHRRAKSLEPRLLSSEMLRNSLKVYNNRTKENNKQYTCLLSHHRHLNPVVCSTDVCNDRLSRNINLPRKITRTRHVSIPPKRHTFTSSVVRLQHSKGSEAQLCTERQPQVLDCCHLSCNCWEYDYFNNRLESPQHISRHENNTIVAALGQSLPRLRSSNQLSMSARQKAKQLITRQKLTQAATHLPSDDIMQFDNSLCQKSAISECCQRRRTLSSKRLGRHAITSGNLSKVRAKSHRRPTSQVFPCDRSVRLNCHDSARREDNKTYKTSLSECDNKKYCCGIRRVDYFPQSRYRSQSRNDNKFVSIRDANVMDIDKNNHIDIRVASERSTEAKTGCVYDVLELLTILRHKEEELKINVEGLKNSKMPNLKLFRDQTEDENPYYCKHCIAAMKTSNSKPDNECLAMPYSSSEIDQYTTNYNTYENCYAANKLGNSSCNKQVQRLQAKHGKGSAMHSFNRKLRANVQPSGTVNVSTHPMNYSIDMTQHDAITSIAKSAKYYQTSSNDISFSSSPISAIINSSDSSKCMASTHETITTKCSPIGTSNCSTSIYQLHPMSIKNKHNEKDFNLMVDREVQGTIDVIRSSSYDDHVNWSLSLRSSTCSNKLIQDCSVSTVFTLNNRNNLTEQQSYPAIIDSTVTASHSTTIAASTPHIVKAMTALPSNGNTSLPSTPQIVKVTTALPSNGNTLLPSTPQIVKVTTALPSNGNTSIPSTPHIVKVTTVLPSNGNTLLPSTPQIVKVTTALPSNGKTSLPSTPHIVKAMTALPSNGNTLLPSTPHIVKAMTALPSNGKTLLPSTPHIVKVTTALPSNGNTLLPSTPHIVKATTVFLSNGNTSLPSSPHIVKAMTALPSNGNTLLPSTPHIVKATTLFPSNGITSLPSSPHIVKVTTALPSNGKTSLPSTPHIVKAMTALPSNGNTLLPSTPHIVKSMTALPSNGNTSLPSTQHIVKAMTALPSNRNTSLPSTASVRVITGETNANGIPITESIQISDIMKSVTSLLNVEATMLSSNRLIDNNCVLANSSFGKGTSSVQVDNSIYPKLESVANAADHPSQFHELTEDGMLNTSTCLDDCHDKTVDSGLESSTSFSIHGSDFLHDDEEGAIKDIYGILCKESESNNIDHSFSKNNHVSDDGCAKRISETYISMPRLNDQSVDFQHITGNIGESVHTRAVYPNTLMPRIRIFLKGITKIVKKFPFFRFINRNSISSDDEEHQNRLISGSVVQCNAKQVLGYTSKNSTDLESHSLMPINQRDKSKKQISNNCQTNEFTDVGRSCVKVNQLNDINCLQNTSYNKAYEMLHGLQEYLLPILQYTSSVRR